jgi:hypothetical protein
LGLCQPLAEQGGNLNFSAWLMKNMGIILTEKDEIMK